MVQCNAAINRNDNVKGARFCAIQT